MNIVIKSVDHAPEDLYGQTPVRGRLLRTIAKSDQPESFRTASKEYWLAELPTPLSWTQEDVTRTIRHLIVAQRWEGTSIRRGAKIPVGVAYVLDDSVLSSETFASTQVEYVAIGMAKVSGEFWSGIGNWLRSVRMRRLNLVLLAVLLAVACDRERTVTYKQPPTGSYTVGTRQVKVGDSIVPVDGASVTAEFFRTVGVQPLLGRPFVGEEHGRLATTVVALSHDFWKERFDSSPAIIGRQLEIDGQPTTVVAVFPPGFTLPGATLVWTPK